MMNRKVTLLLSVLLLSSFMMKAQAPWQAAWVEDSVSMGPGTSADVFYSLSNGTSKIENNRNYHLAFSMSPILDSAAVWANHQSGNNFTKVFNPHKDKTQFATVALSDTTTATLMFNNDQGWFDGALNHIDNPSVFNFGWGTYDFTSHRVFGDSVFIIRANNVYYKLMIDSLNGYTNTYYFRTENMSTPSFTNSYVIAKTPKYSSSLFAYFNLAQGADTLREPANSSWDFMFCRYTTAAPGSGQFPNNNVVGVLLNKGVKAARAGGVLEDTAYDYRTNYPLDSLISRIGWDWKIFDLASSQYIMLDTLSYFVQDKSSNLWQLDFLGFSGSPTGNFNFRKRPVFPVSVENMPANLNQVAVAPNPANDKLNVIIDAKTADQAKLQILDIQGRLLVQQNIQLHAGLNSYQLPVVALANGQYILHVQGTHWTLNEKIGVSK